MLIVDTVLTPLTNATPMAPDTVTVNACPLSDCERARPCGPGQQCTYSDYTLRCVACQAKEFSTGLQCRPCPPGTGPSPSRANCVTCPSGKAGTGCVTCQSGEEPSVDQTKCVACMAGKASGGAGRPCMRCTGKSFPNAQRTGCVPCRSYEYLDAQTYDCKACEVGLQLNRNGTACERCPMGKQSVDAFTACKACSDGEVPLLSRGGCVGCPMRQTPDIPTHSVCVCDNTHYNATQVLFWCAPEGAEFYLKCAAGSRVTMTGIQGGVHTNCTQQRPTQQNKALLVCLLC